IKKIIIFFNGKHSHTILRVKTQNVTFPFIHKTNHHDENTIIFAADNGFKRVIKEKICYSKLFLFGDFDSISTTHLKKSKNDKNIEVTILPKEKNLSDFACILDHIQSHFSHQQLYIE